MKLELEFKTYEIAKYNPIKNYEGKLIVALPDKDGNYTLYIHFKNGLGLESMNRFNLHEAYLLIERYGKCLEYEDHELYLQVSNEVLDQPGILNRRLKNKLRASGRYWRKGDGA